MIKLIMYKADGMRFCFDAISFEHGLSIAREKCFSMGLIGRFVILYKDIDFSDLDYITFKDIDFLYSLQEEKNEKIDDFEESEEISKTSNSSLLKKAKINIPTIKMFSEGNWDGYNTVKNEIMRFYITLNMEQDFIETIS